MGSMEPWRRRESEPTGLARRHEKGLRFWSGKRLGQDEDSVEAVDEREGAGDQEGQAGVDGAEEASNGGAEDEAEAEGCAQHAERGGAAFAGSDVGYVGHRSGNAG